MVVRAILSFVFGVLWIGCGASGATEGTAEASSGGDAAEISSSADEELALLEPVTMPPEENAPRQGDVIDAGAIARARVQAVVAEGIPRFLQRVRSEAHKDGARFVGWRLLSIFNDPTFVNGPIRIGDTVLGVNGRTIERPDQFFSVWETLPSAQQIVFQMLRGGQAYEVRYAIQD